MLGSSTRIMFCLLVCIGLLSENRYKVSALRSREFILKETQGDKAGAHPDEIVKLKSMDIHFRHNREDQGMLRGNHRILEEVSKNKVEADEKMQVQKNQEKDSLQSSKRHVRRGSDPIHNKSQPFS